MIQGTTERPRRIAAAQFGLGCFHVVPRAEAGHGEPVSRVASGIAAALAAVPGVAGVDVVFAASREGVDPPFAEFAPHFATGRAAHSGEHDLEIDFRLAVTRELLDGLGPLYRGLGRWPRDISVRLVYVREVPVVVAWSMEGHEEATGTAAIDIVRRHLELALAGGAFVLDVLEPTPFPADLRIFERPPGAPGDQFVAVSLRVQPGFDLIDVEVDTEGSSLDAMIDHVLWQALLEADDYYRLVLGMAEIERLWDAAVARFDAFVAGERRRAGWPPRGASAAIRELMLGFIETKAAVLAAWHELAGRVEKARNSDVGLLSAHIVQRYERLPAFPFDEYMRMLDFLEGRRTHRSDALTAILSAIIGGLVGGLYVLFGG